MLISDWSSDVCSSDLSVVHAGIDIALIRLVVRLQGGFVLGPSVGDSLVQFRTVQQHRRLDPGYVLGLGLPSIERDGRSQFVVGDGCGVSNAKPQEVRVGKECVRTSSSRWES